MKQRMTFTWTMAAALCLGTTACGDDAQSDDEGDGHGHGDHDAGGGGSDDDDGLEVAGEWTGEFGDESISDDDWNGSEIVAFDNGENFAITQNAEDADFDPGKFNKNVWTEPNDDGFYYCTVDFGLDSAEEAEDTDMTADEQDLEEGCGGFPWTQLMPQ
jgi:hypothetical protein